MSVLTMPRFDAQGNPIDEDGQPIVPTLEPSGTPAGAPPRPVVPPAPVASIPPPIPDLNDDTLIAQAARQKMQQDQGASTPMPDVVAPNPASPIPPPINPNISENGEMAEPQGAPTRSITPPPFKPTFAQRMTGFQPPPPAVPQNAANGAMQVPQEPVPRAPGILQRLGSAGMGFAAGYVNAAGRSYIPPATIQAAKEGILHPGYGAQMEAYQRNVQQIQQQSAMNAEAAKEKTELANAASQEEQRAATAEWRKAQAASAAAAPGIKSADAIAKRNEALEQQYVKQWGTDAQLQKASDPVPPGMSSTPSPTQPGMVYVHPPPFAALSDELAPFAVGHKAGEIVPRSVIKAAEAAYNTDQTRNANKPQVEKDKSKYQTIIGKLRASGEIPTGAVTDANKTYGAIQNSKTLSPEDKDFGTGYLLTNPTPGQAGSNTTVRIQNEVDARNKPAPPIDPGTPRYRVAQDLAYGKLTMQQFRGLYSYSRDPQQKLAIYDLAADLNPNFNPASFEMGFTLAKNPKVQQQLAALDNVKLAVPDLIAASNAASRSGATILNKAIVPGGIAVGNKKYSNFRMARIAFADELSGALGFGSATDMSREMGFNMTDENLSPENFRSAVQDIIIPFLDRKRGTMLNQMGTYGQPGMNPAAGPASPSNNAPSSGGGRGNFAPQNANDYLKSIGVVK
jgi:hypothetical protein